MAMPAAQNTGRPAPQNTGRAARFGWLFAAVWLVYLAGNVGTLLKQPDPLWRYVGLVAVAGFAATYLSMVRLSGEVRYSAARPPEVTARAWRGIATMLVLFALQLPGAGERALSCLVYMAAFAMVS